MVFDVKYDLRHKARLVAGCNWTVNDKEDIYSGVVRMNTVRIKEKVYVTAGPEFGVDLHGENLVIDKSLNGLKTSAARFHEHLSVSLLR
jgi:hypothetical protein